MRNFKGKVLLVVLALCLVLSLAACTSQGDTKAETTTAKSQETKTATTTEATKETESVKLVALIERTDQSYMEAVLDKINNHFTDYDIVIKAWDSNSVETTVKTMIASGNPCDLVFYWPNYMNTFVESGMALDLTPYLEANNGEWKNSFVEGSLEIGKYDGKYYNIAVHSVYPMLIANKDLTDKAGVTLPEGDWTWDEFLDVCDTIKTELDVFPFGIKDSHACWIVRNGFLTIWEDRNEIDAFINGEIPFSVPEVKKVLDDTKILYDNEYCYPGKGALIVTLEELKAAFKDEKIAMFAYVNSQAKVIVDDSELENVQIVSWPHMGPNDYLLGGCDGYFIPSNSVFVDEAVELLKYITGPDCMQLVADSGTPVTTKGVTSLDPNILQYARDTSKVYPGEVINLSSKLNEAINKKLPADYINSGDAVIERLEALRQEALGE